MTPAESVADIRHKFHVVEKALDNLRSALADALSEHGEVLGIDPGTVTAAAAPKNPPPNN